MKKYLVILLSIFLIGFISSTGMPYPYGDYDSDGVLNKDDNCYYVYNPFQVDSDGDSWGDVCDPSSDGFCGDVVCGGDEDYVTCPEDCETPLFCGDGTCDEDENCSTCSNDCGECEIPPQNQTQSTTSRSSHSHKKSQIEFCEVNWKCSGWSECNNGLMIRQCFDENHCDYSYNKPIEETGCDTQLKVLVKEDKNNSVFILTGILTSLILIVVLVSFLRKH